MKKKPTGFAEFDALTRQLLQVPKREIDSQVKRYEAAKSLF
jgi:hypothetical protein